MYELQTQEGPAGLAPLGSVELRELAYGDMRAAMQAAEKPAESAERLLAASLHINGQAVGFDQLQTLPGRYSGAIAKALEQCLRLHGLVDDAPADETPKG